MYLETVSCNYFVLKYLQIQIFKYVCICWALASACIVLMCMHACYLHVCMTFKLFTDIYTVNGKIFTGLNFCSFQEYRESFLWIFFYIIQALYDGIV